MHRALPPSRLLEEQLDVLPFMLWAVARWPVDRASDWVGERVQGTAGLTLVTLPRQRDSQEPGAMSRGWHTAALGGLAQGSEVSDRN